jgi:hypothetical protein
VWLPEAHALEGTPLLSGAQQVPVQRKLKSLSQGKGPPPRASRFLSPGEVRLVGASFLSGTD